jgi:hypothetical protein
VIFPWQLGISFFILEINLFWIVWQWCLVWPWFSAYILDKCPYGCIDKKHPELLKTCFWSAYVPKLLNFQLVWEKYQGDVFAISRCICNPWNFEVFFFFFLYFLKFVIVYFLLAELTAACSCILLFNAVLYLPAIFWKLLNREIFVSPCLTVQCFIDAFYVPWRIIWVFFICRTWSKDQMVYWE